MISQRTMHLRIVAYVNALLLKGQEKPFSLRSKDHNFGCNPKIRLTLTMAEGECLHNQAKI